MEYLHPLPYQICYNLFMIYLISNGPSPNTASINVIYILTSFTIRTSTIQISTIFGKFTVWKKLATLATCFMGRSSYSCKYMMRMMLRFSKYLKIVNSIISSYMVNMVDYFTRFKFTFKVLFHNISVFINRFTGYRNNFIFHILCNNRYGINKPYRRVVF